MEATSTLLSALLAYQHYRCTTLLFLNLPKTKNMSKIPAILLACSGLLLLLVWSACIPETEEPNTVSGLQPVYVTPAEAHHIYAGPPRNIVKLGKIYTKPPLIYLNESGMGVHVVDNSNPSNPHRIAFINIPGNQDIAIKNNYLYADNAGDLVTLDISNLENVVEVNRIANLYPLTQSAYPLDYNGYFECVDSTKGIIVGWIPATLEDPKCFR